MKPGLHLQKALASKVASSTRMPGKARAAESAEHVPRQDVSIFASLRKTAKRRQALVHSKRDNQAYLPHAAR